VNDVARHMCTVSRDITQCPRQDSNLRSRLRSPVNHEVPAALSYSNWAFMSPDVSLVDSRGR